MLSSSPHVDKGVRKFRGMIITQAWVFAGFVLTGWFRWPETLFEMLVWPLVVGFVGFAVPNVVEKLLPLFQRKPPAA